MLRLLSARGSFGSSDVVTTINDGEDDGEEVAAPDIVGIWNNQYPGECLNSTEGERYWTHQPGGKGKGSFKLTCQYLGIWGLESFVCQCGAGLVIERGVNGSQLLKAWHQVCNVQLLVVHLGCET